MALIFLTRWPLQTWKLTWRSLTPRLTWLLLSKMQHLRKKWPPEKPTGVTSTFSAWEHSRRGIQCSRLQYQAGLQVEIHLTSTHLRPRSTTRRLWSKWLWIWSHFMRWINRDSCVPMPCLHPTLRWHPANITGLSWTQLTRGSGKLKQHCLFYRVKGNVMNMLR